MLLVFMAFLHGSEATAMISSIGTGIPLHLPTFYLCQSCLLSDSDRESTVRSDSDSLHSISTDGFSEIFNREQVIIRYRYFGLYIFQIRIRIRDAPEIRLIQRPDTGCPVRAGYRISGRIFVFTNMFLVKYKIVFF
jgi:hypothetical protein